MKMKKKYALLLLLPLFTLAAGWWLKQSSSATQFPLIAHRWGTLAKLDELKALLTGFNIKSIIDTSCEEAGLLEQIDLGIEHYIGIDRRKEVVEAIRSSIGSAKRTFLVQDITRDLLPQADLILCWDNLQSLPISQIRSTLLLFHKSQAKYLLISHFPELKKNCKGKWKGYRQINWTLAPYFFPEPMIQISEQREHGQIKSLALWKISELP